MESLSIIHTVASLDVESAGPSYTVPRLAKSLIAQGHKAEVYTLGNPGSTIDQGLRITRYKRDLASVPIAARLGRSRSMSSALLKSDATVFHTHGLWMMPNVYPGTASQSLRRPFVLTPRGMLGRDPLKFSAGPKRVFLALWQARALSRVTCFHATAASEFEDIRAFGLSQPVAIIPNGIDLPPLAPQAGLLPEKGDPFVLSLGRIHPKKGLDRLISAFALVAMEHPHWILRIVGPDEGNYSEQLNNQIHQSGLSGRVSIEPPVFGEQKFALMRQARVFALATLDENFGMTVAESLAVRTPVISTHGAPWSGLSGHRCGWWVPHGPEPMAAALREAMMMPREALLLMGTAGRDWMERDFAWDGIGEKMSATYRWINGVGQRPAWVQT